MNTSMIDLKGLKKSYKNFSIGPLDLKVNKGTAVALVGTNGSGKTTLFRIMMNLLQVDQGSIHYFGYDLAENETEIKQNIGYVGELLEPYGNLTIKEIASMIAYWYPTWNEKKYAYFLKRYNINENEKYGKCSKGTKKKVEFIFALSHETKVLLLDEPSAGLDMISQQKMKEDLLNYMEDGERSIVLATHNIDELKQLCDEIVIIEEGKIITTFNKDDVYEKWARVWLSELPSTSFPHILQVEKTPPQIVTDNFPFIEKELEKLGISIFHSNRLSLEEVVDHMISREKE